MDHSGRLPPLAQSTPNKKPTTREQILQAALACFSDKGYHQTTMDDIVKESGLSKGSLYWYFKSKQELFISLIDWFMTGVGEEVFQAWTDEMSAAEKIRAMIGAFVNESEQYIPFFKITLDFWAQTSEDEQLRQIFDSILDQFQAQLSALIEEGVANGQFRPVDAPALSLALLGMVDSLVLYRTLLGEKIEVRASAEVTLEVLLAGLQR